MNICETTIYTATSLLEELQLSNLESHDSKNKLIDCLYNIIEAIKDIAYKTEIIE